jgi:hypothetical protein
VISLGSIALVFIQIKGTNKIFIKVSRENRRSASICPIDEQASLGFITKLTGGISSGATNSLHEAPARPTPVTSLFGDLHKLKQLLKT